MPDDVIPGSGDEPIEDGQEPAPEPIAGGEPAPGDDGAGDVGGEPQPGANVPEPDDKPAYVRELEDRLAKAEKTLEAKAAPQPQPTQAGEPGPEFFAQMEKDLGFNVVKGPNGEEVTTLTRQQFTKGIFNMMREAVRVAREYSDGLVHTNTSEIRTDAIISDLAVKNPDIQRYRPQIKAYLKEFYAPKDHSNEKFIMAGYYYAMGQASKAAPAAGAPDRRNVRVMRPAPANRGGVPANGKPLGGIAKSMVGSQFADEKEYRAWQNADLNKL